MIPSDILLVTLPVVHDVVGELEFENCLIRSFKMTTHEKISYS